MFGSRILILTNGSLGVFNSKTAASVVRYRGDDVVGVLDSVFEGSNARDALGVERDVPVFASLDDAMSAMPDSLLIGVAPQGGRLDPEWRAILLDAIKRGLSIISGLHEFLNDDDEFLSAAKTSGASLHDIRRPPDALPVAKGFAKTTKALRILAIGTDCNVGKMVATLELNKELRNRGVDSAFIATGQTGIMITGKGIAIDRVISDFAAGAAEQLVLEEKDREVLLIEGQGALTHPGFSGVTLSLLHGSLPHGVLLCHHPGRSHMRGNDTPVSSLTTHIRLCESLCEPLFPTRAIGIVINGYGMSDEALNDEVKRAEDETGLPAVDVIRHGAARLVDPILALKDEVNAAQAKPGGA